MKQQSRQSTGKETNRRKGTAKQSPVPPWNTDGDVFQATEHLRPKIVARLAIGQSRHSSFEQFAHRVQFLIRVSVIHGVIPTSKSFLRSKRTARNMRTFTAFVEMPRAAAISP